MAEVDGIIMSSKSTCRTVNANYVSSTLM